jgi:fucose 4-O-acetylase-like acetyltransferase
MWFLTALFSSYVLYLPIHRTKNRKHRICLICLYALIITFLHTTQFLLPWNLDTAFAGAILIHAGYCCRKYGIFEKLSSKASIVTIIATIPIYITCVNINGGGWKMFNRELGNSGLLSPMLFLCMGICGSYLLCIFSFCLEKLKLSSLLGTIGRHTLTILCSHYFIYGIVTPIISYCISFHPALQAIAPYCFILQITAAVIFAIFFDKMKNPALQLIKNNLQRTS